MTVTVSSADEPEGSLGMESLGLEPLGGGPAPLAMNLNTGGEDAADGTGGSDLSPLAMSLYAGRYAAAVGDPPAHDAVMRDEAQRESESPEISLDGWDWLWWYDFEQTRMNERSSRKDTLAEKAADELLAAGWA